MISTSYSCAVNMPYVYQPPQYHPVEKVKEQDEEQRKVRKVEPTTKTDLNPDHDG